MYTSGSTGQPKGAEVYHGGIVGLLFGLDCVTLNGDETLLQLAPISFDASTFEIWGALLHGGRCVVFEDRIPTPASLERVIEDFGVTTVHLTTSLLNSVVDESVQSLRGAKQLLTGGEAASPVHLRKAVTELPDTRIINCYGPTECTTFATCYPVPAEIEDDLVSIPIGRPVSGRRVYVLDTHDNLVPIGVSGELCIGGEGLARGYLNRAELTAEKFVPNPFDKDSESRLYRTGDRCRWLPDGTLEFRGRLDEQVKLRGYRIELGEIESVLDERPDVARSVVTLRQDLAGDERLVGYYVPTGKVQPDFAELSAYLKTKLPEYMVPTVLITLESLPLTPRGKLDREALPSPNIEQCVAGAEYVAPRTPIEELLVGIWQELLGSEMVGIHDNFFDLGGHSLLAVRIVTRVDRQCGVAIPVSAVFDSPSIAELASRILNQSLEGDTTYGDAAGDAQNAS
jgi:acyl-coenzyme A synthetase/AMP-(fatty) acid ligase/acyl carrier protein